MSTATVEFINYPESLCELLVSSNADAVLKKQKKILLKPNLVNTSPPPVTTPVELCAELVKWLKNNTEAEIVIGEGTGDLQNDTDYVFNVLGYRKLAEDYSIRLIDLNESETKILQDKSCSVFPEFHMPIAAMEYYIISLPVLKAHSLAMITGTLKNMMGFAQPKYYQKGGMWKKSAFHSKMHQSILDLNRYRTPDYTILDATVGLSEYHLGGAECSPCINKLVAGFNPLDIDRKAAELLGLNWEKIPHLK